MFGLLKRKNPYEQNARSIYFKALEHARSPEFYEEYGVPDSFDGRFDLVVLHLYMIITAILENEPDEARAKAFNQTLFDVSFEEMKLNLRELSIGDMGIPKHMKRMMLAFNGRVHAYDDARSSGQWAVALSKNLYGTLDQVDDKHLEKMQNYIEKSISALNSQEFVKGIIEDARLNFPKA